jgi:hypothetical protein
VGNAMIATVAVMAALASAPREPYSVARMTAFGEYFDGSKLAGHGTRERYDGGAAGFDLEAVRVPADFGLEARLQLGGAFSTYRDRASRAIMFELGGAFAILHVGSFSLAGAGGLGIGAGRHVFVDTVRLYPYVGLRARAWFSDATSLHLNAYVLPITTSGVRDLELRAEAALGVSWLMAGVRGSRIAYSGGDPRRLYGELSLALFVGAAFY